MSSFDEIYYVPDLNLDELIQNYRKKVLIKLAQNKDAIVNIIGFDEENDKIEEKKIEKVTIEEERNKRNEKKRIENERIENERIKKERIEKERIEKERIEKERIEKEKIEKERIEKEKERIEKERKFKIKNENERKIKIMRLRKRINKNGKFVLIKNKNYNKRKNLAKHIIQTTISYMKKDFCKKHISKYFKMKTITLDEFIDYYQQKSKEFKNLKVIRDHWLIKINSSEEEKLKVETFLNFCEFFIKEKYKRYVLNGKGRILSENKMYYLNYVNYLLKMMKTPENFISN